MKLPKSRISEPWIVLAALVGMTFSLEPACAAETGLKKVTLAYTSLSPSILRFSLEKELGFFRDEGLRPELILVRGGGIAVRGLMAGNFDYVIPTGPIADAIIKSREPLKVVLTSWMSNYWIVTQPQIRSIGDLKGKIIGTASPGSVTEILMREILKRHGLDPFKDAALLGLGASNERMAALASGNIHATLLTPPFNFRAVEMGYRKLAVTGDYLKWPAGGLGTREEKIVREPEEVGRVVRASYKGHKFLMTQREYILSKIRQIFGLAPADAIQTYQAIMEEALPAGYDSEDTERRIISVMKQAANVTEDIPRERVFDHRFVKQAEQELKGWKPQAPK
jgi:NitT/TauT family transport system substrate-binding protein